jgi:hypothetical protein
MTRRLLIAVCLVLTTLVAWPEAPHAQRFPTISSDLSPHPAGHRGHRVIIQGDASALAVLRQRHPRAFVRVIEGGAVLDQISDTELNDLQHDGSLLHISGDLPVRAGMAVTNKVTAAETVWQGTNGLLGLLATPGSRLPGSSLCGAAAITSIQISLCGAVR